MVAGDNLFHEFVIDEYQPVEPGSDVFKWQAIESNVTEQEAVNRFRELHDRGAGQFRVRRSKTDEIITSSARRSNK